MGLHVKRVSQHRFYHFSGAWFNVKAWRTGRQYARQESAGAEGGTKCPPAPPLRYIGLPVSLPQVVRFRRRQQPNSPSVAIPTKMHVVGSGISEMVSSTPLMVPSAPWG